jgi:YidC/Oxa1 family membrane protein insertase
MHTIWNLFIYQPLHNALVFLIGIMPSGDVGLAIILLTIVVKLILFPLSQKSIRSQVEMKLIEPDIKKIKETYPDKAEQQKQTFALYKEKGVNPFSGCLVMLIQLPIIFALYYIFKDFDIHALNLYSFIHEPVKISTNLFGILDITKKSLVLALMTGISQFFQMRLTMPKTPTVATGDKSFGANLAQSMNFQMKYILPVFIAFVSYSISAGVALYWFTSNLFAIGQEIYVRNKIRKETV